MPYEYLELPSFPDRPFFYTNFVQTVDGKTWVNKNGRAYWPIGSKLDYQTLITLRAYADVLVHGKSTATWIRTLDNLGKSEFQKLRQDKGKSKPILYLVISAHPDSDLLSFLENPPQGTEVLLATTEKATLPAQLASQIHVKRFGDKSVDLRLLSAYLRAQGHNQVLVEGGPHTLNNFLEESLLDELFITLSPKLFGGKDSLTLSLTEGTVFPPNAVKQLRLLSVEQVEDEVYLRYQLKKPNAG